VKNFEEKKFCPSPSDVADADGLCARSKAYSRIDGRAYLDLPLWARIILKLAIPVPCIPDFLESRFPSIMALICYGYLPSFIISAYMLLTLYIMMAWFTFPWNYLVLFSVFMPLLLVWLRVLIERNLSYVNTIMKSAIWDPEKTLEEYTKLLKKRRTSKKA